MSRWKDESRRDRLEKWEQKIDAVDAAAAVYAADVAYLRDELVSTLQTAKRASNGEMSRKEAVQEYAAIAAQGVDDDTPAQEALETGDALVDGATGDGLTTTQLAIAYGDRMDRIRDTAETLQEQHGDLDRNLLGMDEKADTSYTGDDLADLLGQAHEYIRCIDNVDHGTDTDGYRFRDTSVEEKKADLRDRYRQIQETVCTRIHQELERITAAAEAFPDSLDGDVLGPEPYDWETDTVMDAVSVDDPTEYGFASEAAMRDWIDENLTA